MQDPIHPGLAAYMAAKLQQLNDDNAAMREMAERRGGSHTDMTHYIVQIVVDAKSGKLTCATRYIVPGREHQTRAESNGDLLRLFGEAGVPGSE